MQPCFLPLHFLINNEAGEFLVYAWEVLYEGTILAYNPSTNKAEWFPVYGSIKILIPTEQVSATDLNNMVLHSPTRGEGSPPAPSSRLRKFAKECEGRGAAAAMEEGGLEEEEGGISRCRNVQVSDIWIAVTPHYWTEDES